MIRRQHDHSSQQDVSGVERYACNGHANGKDRLIENAGEKREIQDSWEGGARERGNDKAYPKPSTVTLAP